MKIGSSQWALGVLMLVGVVGNSHADARMPAMLSAGRIVETLHRAGVEAAAGEVEFVGSVPASAPDVPLRITGWRKLNRDTVWVKLTCQHSQDCLPFFVLLHPADRASIASFSAIPTVSTPVGSMKKIRKSALIRAGSHATLVLRSGATWIRTSVICLDSGERGSRIRVRNLATKRILAAEIVDRGLVQASF
jgi:flagellar basal body P-ring formation chaperone FlgA